MTDNSNPDNVDATRKLGGEVIFHGPKFNDARNYAEELAVKNGYRYFHSANEPLLVAGVGTHTPELIESDPEIDAIIVPVGDESGSRGAAIVAETMSKDIKVIGAQSEMFPAAYKARKSGVHE